MSAKIVARALAASRLEKRLAFLFEKFDEDVNTIRVSRSQYWATEHGSQKAGGSQAGSQAGSRRWLDPARYRLYQRRVCGSALI